MKILPMIMLILTPIVAAQQLYQGPASGFVTSGITKSTDEFSIEELPENVLPTSKEKRDKENVNFQLALFDMNLGENDNPHISNKFPRVNSIRVAEELSFDGPNAVGCWVPDCNITPGPVDVLIPINTTFWITDRNGNLLKQINVNNWFADFIGTGLVFDPKSFYDDITKRFYMIYLYRDSSIDETLILVSVSDDSTAEGNWNNWAVRGDLNGSQVADYYVDFPSLVVTNDAMYVAIDVFPHTGGNPVYSKLRAFPLNDLIQDSAAVLSYTDIWDFRNPRFPNSILRTLKLVHDYDQTGNAFLTGFNVNTAPQNYIAVYEVSDIFGAANVNSVAIDTSPFQLTPHMVQKGGGFPVQLFHLFYSEMFRRNNKIYIAHSTRDGSLASIHYMEVNTNSWQLDDEIFLGNEGYYYGYPDLIVDEEDNVFMIYERSSANEYPGVFYTAKSVNAGNFYEDLPLMEGMGNMSVLGCGSTSNYVRFGDYTDIMFDPIEKDKIWLMGEYVGSDNSWKTRVAKVSIDEIITDVAELEPIHDFKLEQNYPNPFNPSTIISYSLPQAAVVNIVIYNMLGQTVRTLVEMRNHSAGTYEVNWNGKDDSGNLVSSGTYIYRMIAGSIVESRKLTLLR